MWGSPLILLGSDPRPPCFCVFVSDLRQELAVQQKQQVQDKKPPHSSAPKELCSTPPAPLAVGGLPTPPLTPPDRRAEGRNPTSSSNDPVCTPSRPPASPSFTRGQCVLGEGSCCFLFLGGGKIGDNVELPGCVCRRKPLEGAARHIGPDLCSEHRWRVAEKGWGKDLHPSPHDALLLQPKQTWVCCLSEPGVQAGVMPGLHKRAGGEP